MEQPKAHSEASVRVASDLRHRSFAGPIGNLVVFCILLVATPLYRDHPLATTLYVGIGGGRILVRLALTALWNQIAGVAPVFPRWMIAASVGTLSLPTGAFTAFVIAHYGFESWSTLFVATFAVICATSGPTAIAPSLRLSLAFEATLLAPIVATCLFMASGEGYAVAAALTLFGVYVSLEAKRQNVDYWNAIAADHALKRRAEQLQAARVAADAASRAKSQFLANMSHEIRTPMNGVLGMLELVLNSDLSSEQREQLGYARESAQSLLVLLNQLLDHSKAEAGRLELESIDFELRRLVEEALGTFRAQAQSKGVVLAASLGDDLPEHLRGDPTRLRQIILNLVSNAVKFTPSGTVTVAAVLEQETGDGLTLHFTVIDSGPGIPPDKLKQVFEAFSQVDSSITRRYGGTGLGLTICRDLVTLMGGRIWAESSPGQGSTFHFTAVLTRSQTSPLTIPLPAQGIGQGVIGPLRILVAEDNLINQKVLGRLLARRGHSCEIATTGLEAVKRFREGGFDGILMDVHMPEMDGREASRRIRAAESLVGGHIPIVGVTASAARADIEECLEAGMDSCIAKPIVVPELDAALARIADHRPQSKRPRNRVAAGH